MRGGEEAGGRGRGGEVAGGGSGRSAEGGGGGGAWAEEEVAMEGVEGSPRRGERGRRHGIEIGGSQAQGRRGKESTEG